MKKYLTILGLSALISFSALGAGPECIDGYWYYRAENGETVKDAFITLDGNTYYFGRDGRLCADILVEKDGNRYGLEENGTMIRSKWKLMKNADGKNSRWMYFGFDGRAFSDGWFSDGGSRYHFTEGCMDYGWYTEEDGSVYYLGDANDGKAYTGWFIWRGADVPGNEEHEHGWYYFSAMTGKMAAGREITIGSEIYAFTENGTQAAGFCVIETGEGKTEKYYDTSNGSRASGWLYVDKDTETEEHPAGWYYFFEGVPLSPSFHTIKLSENLGVASIDGMYYAFDTCGKMQTGLIEAGNGKKYYFDSDGRMQTGNVCVSKDHNTEEYMYFDTQGAAPPALGCAVNGVRGDYVYDQGFKLTAESESFEEVTVETNEGKHSYVVSKDGKIRKSGTVRMSDGRLMRICNEDGSYYLRAQ